MHTKINTHQNDSNFPTHDLWSKPKLGMQHIHLELLWILSLCNYKEKQANFKNNIYDKYKIVINSPEVHFA
jgi:hypothetical protein